MPTGGPELGAGPRTLGELVGRSAARFGDRTALIADDRRLSYRELRELSDGYARSLMALGAEKGSRVALLMENVPEWLALDFAATGIGAVLVALSTFSKERDLAYQLEHADVTHLVMSARFLKNDYLAAVRSIVPELELLKLDRGPLRSRRLPALRHVIVRGEPELPAGAIGWEDFVRGGEHVSEAALRACQATVGPDDECYLLYTSGTTADPKGVVHVHQAVATNGWRIGECQGLVPDDIAWFYFPLFFSAGCINVAMGTLSHGAAVILQPAFEPAAAIEAIEREGATTWHLWPHTLKALMEHPDWARRDHSALHKGTGPYDLVIGAGPADGLGGVNMYGLTETCTAFTCTQAGDPARVRLSTQGVRFPDTELKIVDPATGGRVPDGVQGEICVKGVNVLRRYHKVDPAETFDDEGFFHTGDLGSVDPDGRLRYEQRISDVIKTGGINVSPAEVESVLTTIPGVDAAYVFAVPDPDRGSDVAAAVVPKPGAAVDEGLIRERCAELLPAHKRPKALLFLSRDEVPMTGSGKAQTFLLRERLLSGE